MFAAKLNGSSLLLIGATTLGFGITTPAATAQIWGPLYAHADTYVRDGDWVHSGSKDDRSWYSAYASCSSYDSRGWTRARATAKSMITWQGLYVDESEWEDERDGITASANADAGVKPMGLVWGIAGEGAYTHAELDFRGLRLVVPFDANGQMDCTSEVTLMFRVAETDQAWIPVAQGSVILVAQPGGGLDIVCDGVFEAGQFLVRTDASGLWGYAEFDPNYPVIQSDALLPVGLPFDVDLQATLMTNRPPEAEAHSEPSESQIAITLPEGFELIPPDEEDPIECPGDLDGNGAVDFGDILHVLSDWGPCPE